VELKPLTNKQRKQYQNFSAKFSGKGNPNWKGGVSRGENKAAYDKEQKRLYVGRYREFVRAQKNVPCADCKQTYHPCMMDFDHRDRSKKTMEISKLIRLRPSKAKLLAEIAKCQVVCSNCHRLRTYIAQVEINKRGAYSERVR
jgi:hypothetical protein